MGRVKFFIGILVLAVSFHSYLGPSMVFSRREQKPFKSVCQQIRFFVSVHREAARGSQNIIAPKQSNLKNSWKTVQLGNAVFAARPYSHNV